MILAADGRGSSVVRAPTREPVRGHAGSGAWPQGPTRPAAACPYQVPHHGCRRPERQDAGPQQGVMATGYHVVGAGARRCRARAGRWLSRDRSADPLPKLVDRGHRAAEARAACRTRGQRRQQLHEHRRPQASRSLTPHLDVVRTPLARHLARACGSWPPRAVRLAAAEVVRGARLTAMFRRSILLPQGRNARIRPVGRQR